VTARDVDVSQSEDSYVRGGGAGSNGPRMIQLFLGACFLTLAALVITLVVQAAGENARADGLHRHGVPVTATVTGCLGVASGTGITVAAFDCKATFVQAGRTHTEVLRGSTALLQTGATISAVVAPGDPGSLSTVAAAAQAGDRSPWARYTAAGITLVVLVGFGVAVWMRYRILRNR
jgi:hypothetical protein